MTPKTLQFFSLFKPRIGFSISLTALTGVMLTPVLPTFLDLMLVLAATFFATAAVGCYNQIYDYDIDALMRRTQNRPFATGFFVRHTGWFVLVLAVLSIPLIALIWMGHLWPAIFTFLGAFFYAVIYTIWLKRRSWSSIVIGGLAGSFAILAGSTMTAPLDAPLPLVFALILFLWTPPHFWSLAIALQSDFMAAGIPVLPAIIGPQRTAQIVLFHTLLLILATLLPLYFGMGWVYLLMSSIGNAIFAWYSFLLAREALPVPAKKNFYASLAQLGSVLLGAILNAPWMG